MTPQVEIVRTAVITAAVVHLHVNTADLPLIGERIGRALATVMTELLRADVGPAGPALARYRPTTDGFDVSAGFRVPATFVPSSMLDRLELGGVEAAHITHIGPYRDLPTAYEELRTQAAAASRPVVAGGPMWEEYGSAPGTPESETRTEIYWPVEG